ncbi:MAG: hypothetical protein K2Y29_15835 [Beijerinckiaceae bacterium]|nr:hypothetical protein [Beijerinckiaceae bacterium]
MSRAASLSDKEHDANTREAALDAARRAGLTLAEWLDETWRLHASDIRAHVDDLDDDERAYAVARRLAHRRMPGEASRRSDRLGSDAGAGRRSALSESGERIWRLADRAYDDMSAERPREPSARERYETAREERARRDDIAPRPRRRLSVEDAIEDIAERQNELDFGRQRAPRAAAADSGQPALKRELAKLADSLADLQRGASAGASARDFDALRTEVAHIARGLSALAPRQSVEHIEAAVNDLARRLADARDGGLVQDFIAPVELLIADLKRAVVGVAPTAALEAVERRLGALARNVEALAQARVDPDSITNLLEHSQDIREMLAAAAASRPNVEALEKRIIDLGARIDRIAERGQTHAGLDAVVQSVAQIRAELEAQNPIKAVKALDGRIDALARKVGEAATRTDVDAHFEQLGKRLDAMHRDLAERAPEGRKLEAMMSALQARIEEARTAAGPAEMRDLVGQLMGRLDQAVGAGANPATIAALEEQITRVAARLDHHNTGDLAPPSQSADLARIEATLDAIVQRLENPLPLAAAEQVQATVRLLIERFEATLRTGVTGETLSAIERRLADVADRLDAPVTAELDTARLEGMIQDLAARMQAPGVAPADVAEIKETLARLADRMETALRGDADPRALRALEEQIAALSARTGPADGPGLASLERSLGQIHEQMERLRSELDGPAREAIEREIADLRSMHTASDRRTHATLNAVHETLEKVVDRLAMLEDEIESAPLAEAAPAAPSSPPRREDAPVPMPRAASFDPIDDYKPSIELNFGPADAGAPVAPAIPAVSAAPAAHMAPPAAPVRAPEPAPAVVAERAAPRAAPARSETTGSAPRINSATDDFLLEPGTGKPSARVVAAAMQTMQHAAAAQPAPARVEPPVQARPQAVSQPVSDLDAPVEPAAETAAPGDAILTEAVAPDAEAPGAQANFIAAVRRAQQAASAAAAPRETGSTGNQILEEARARARAAAAQAEATEPKPSGGALGIAKSLFSGRKRQSIAGMSALVMVLGALQAASMYHQYESAKPVRSAENRAAPKPQPAPEKNIARATAPLTAPSPLSDQFTQSAPLAADMTPVASLPASAMSPSRSMSAPAPRDPYILAAAGDALAQFEVGVRFADGRNATRDAGKAVDWLSKSAAQNFAPAQYRLGVIYEKGLGVPRDGERARALYLSAAEQGNIKAMHNLGALLADGNVGGKPDYAGASHWFRQAAEHGVRDSQYNLAVLSARGLGATQDLVQSYLWFSAAAAQGDTDAGAKLKEVASRLDAAQLAKARALAEAHKPRQGVAAVNDPAEPEGGWATGPEPAAPRPSASRSPKISSL